MTPFEARMADLAAQQAASLDRLCSQLIWTGIFTAVWLVAGGLYLYWPDIKRRLS